MMVNKSLRRMFNEGFFFLVRISYQTSDHIDGKVCQRAVATMLGSFKQTSSKFHEILKAEIFKNRHCFRVPRLSEIPHVGSNSI